jgi:ClpP class serine protease
VIDEVYAEFVSALARYRGVGVATVRSDFGQGRLLSSKQAVAASMADGVGTLTGAIAKLASRRGDSRRARTADAATPVSTEARRLRRSRAKTA